MPVELQVIRASEFVCFDADKHLDFEASQKVLQGLVMACRKRGLDRAMLDLRDLPILPKPHFTPEQMAVLAGTFLDAGFSKHQRLAILYSHDIHGGIRNFTLFSRLRGLQVQAFQQYESAIHWLWEQKKSAEPPHGAYVPITEREAKKRQGHLSNRISHARTRSPKPVRKMKGKL
jgi:hypothetical protein